MFNSWFAMQVSKRVTSRCNTRKRVLPKNVISGGWFAMQVSKRVTSRCNTRKRVLPEKALLKEGTDMDAQTLTKQVEVYITRNGLIARGERVAVALSGGKDSVCLADLLLTLSASMRFSLSAVHVHHGIREAASRDEAFVLDFCAARGIPLTVIHVDAPALAKREKLSLEAAARRLRYEAFEGLPVDKIALAHHQGDQAETLLMHLLRGSGTDGLSAMRPSRGPYIRPLLCLASFETEAYNREKGLDWVEDETNADCRFTRNRIRRELMPLLESFNPRAEETLSRAAELFADESDYLRAEAERLWQADGCRLSCKTLASLPSAAARRLVRRFLEENGGLTDIGACHIEEVLALAGEEEGKRRSLPGDLTLQKKDGIIIPCIVSFSAPAFTPHSLPIPGRCELPGGYTLQAEITAAPGREALLSAGPLEEWIALPEEPGALCLRLRQPGDYLRIRTGKDGALGTKKLQDYLVDAGIPAEERDKTVLLAKGREVVWVIGHRLSDAYRLPDAAEEALHLSVIMSDTKPVEATMLDLNRVHVLIDEDTLEARIQEMAAQISKDYEGKELMLTCVLKGGVMFMTELAKYITVPVSMDFMTLSSYGDGLTSSGQVVITKDMDSSIEGKHVLVVEDIVDTGRTLHFLEEMLWERRPASLAIATMLDKPDRRVVEMIPKYTGFTIEDKFVVGYGLDYAQQYRNLRYIGYIE